jgi:hypothetical protein
MQFFRNVGKLLTRLHSFASQKQLILTPHICVVYLMTDHRSYRFSYKYCDVLPVNTSNNLWVADFCIPIYWIYIRRCLQSLITFPITSHEPATYSGSSSAPSWRKPLLRSFRDELCRTLMMNSYGELLLQTARDELIFQTSLVDCSHQTFIVSAIHC